jgi:CheY-like chemotaxis protein/HPt (histidine-containing phosphotransfer) domain-containing protein
LGNAVKFTPSGAIELRLRPAGREGWVRIEVVDTGPGIALEQRHRLFVDFERLDGQAVRKVEGAGLGLAISAQLAALLGGDLGYSDNPNGGSIFWLDLPMVRQAAAPSTELALAADCSIPDFNDSTVPPLHILVVDDIAMNRNIAQGFLSKAGHYVTTAVDGEEAVETARSTDFDVVFMDIRMPGLDGLEATRRIRALGTARGQVPIVALTAQAFAEQVEECRKVGMDSHVAKPFTPEALLRALTTARAAAQQRMDRNAAESQAAPPEPAVAEPPDLPVCDEAALELVRSFLPPAAIGSYLQNIAAQSEAVCSGARAYSPANVAGQGAGDSKLAHDAHALAGSAGLLGFKSLADAARRYEYAIQTGAPDIARVADRLCDAAQAASHEIHLRMSHLADA